jgi:hypothetical protein
VFAEITRERSSFNSPYISLLMETDIALDRVRLLNDEQRQHLTDGPLIVTRGISSLPVDDQAEILERVRTYDDFLPDNDPYGEHDFGAFVYNRHRVVWKIEYFDRGGGSYGSPDPADLHLTRRVLTVMLAGEY